MKNVNEVLQAKSSELYTVAPDTMVLDAIKLMSEKEVGALMVMDGDRLSGLISERDYARRVILQGKASNETKVSDMIAKEFFVVTPHTTLDECMVIMTQKYARHLPVVENGKVVGMISIGDVVKNIISEQHFTINNLVQYIMWG